MEPGKRRFTRLSAEDAYKLKGVPEIAESSVSMWFCSFNVSNISFFFTPEEINSGRIPPLNGMQNVYFVCYTECFRQYDELVDFQSFSSTFFAYLAQLLTFEAR